MHSGIGPFEINDGSVMSYAKANYSKGAFRAGFFTNILRGDADQLLTRGLNGAPITFAFDTTTLDFEASNVQTFGKANVVSYGANLRFNNNDLSIAPAADNRTEFGIYGQDEIFLSEKFRAVVGGRVDRFDFVDDFVFSPRLALLFKPHADQTFRVSYNKAYRSPSVINNFIDLVISQPVDLSALGVPNPYLLPVGVVGNEDLEVQSLDAFEIGYSGLVANGRAIISAAYYMNWLKNDILFTQDGVYTAASPPVNWPLPPVVIALLAQQGRFLPSTVHLLELRQEHEPGHRARRQRVRQPLRQCLCQLLLSVRSRPEGLSPVRAEPAAEQPVQRRRQLHAGQVSRRTSR